MKLRMLKVGSWCEARPSRVRTEARESIPWLSLLQVGIGYEWRVLPSLLNAVWRQDVAGAASQATWLVQNSSAVFRGQCCAQWAPNRDVEKRNQTVCVLLPALMYQLGPPWRELLHLWKARKPSSEPGGSRKEWAARGMATLQANHGFKYVVCFVI